MCTVIAISLIFIERGKKEEKNGSSNFFYCNGKFCAKSANNWTKNICNSVASSSI